LAQRKSPKKLTLKPSGELRTNSSKELREKIIKEKGSFPYKESFPEIIGNGNKKPFLKRKKNPIFL